MLPTSTNVSVNVKTTVPADCDAVVVFLAEGGKISGDVLQLLGKGQLNAIERLIASGATRGKAREVSFDLIECGKNDYRRVYVAGLGPREKISPESVRQAAGAIARAVRKHRIGNVAIVPPMLSHKGQSGTEAAVTGFLLASFKYDEYVGTGRRKERDEERPGRMGLTVLSIDASAKDLRAKVDRAQIVAEAQNFARTIASRPGNDINPPKLADVARQMCKERGLGFRALDEKQMKKLGMGGILAVGAGSNATPPRMIVMEYKPRGSKASFKPVLAVGKAITFDSGGISIKPAEKMNKMVYDKCGAMAVLGFMAAVGRLKPAVPVVGILSSAENLLSESSYRPGDILRMYNGITVEVTNTDAEGRLVLGDALAWGIETFKPSDALLLSGILSPA